MIRGSDNSRRIRVQETTDIRAVERRDIDTASVGRVGVKQKVTAIREPLRQVMRRLTRPVDVRDRGRLAACCGHAKDGVDRGRSEENRAVPTP